MDTRSFLDISFGIVDSCRLLWNVGVAAVTASDSPNEKIIWNDSEVSRADDISRGPPNTVSTDRMIAVHDEEVVMSLEVDDPVP